MGAGGACSSTVQSSVSVLTDATGRYARCQRAMESESSVELFCGALLLAQALELHAGLSRAAGRLARDVCFCRSHYPTARTAAHGSTQLLAQLQQEQLRPISNKRSSTFTSPLKTG